MALAGWGRECFARLFRGGIARDFYRDACRDGPRLEIVSQDPSVLSWPWEALRDEHDMPLALRCQVERRLDKLGNPPPVSLPHDRLNILYIIARPNEDHDVGLQTLARPLIECIKADGWPVHIDVLRPPTFKNLQDVLRAKPDFYHVVHFDGHGDFAQASGGLVFEADSHNAKADFVDAARLGQLLSRYHIPYMVLNACRSAQMQGDPFASVAVSLLNANIRGVVAMSHNLWVAGAMAFVPAFYRRLLESGDIGEAMLDGRLAMRDKPLRDTPYGQTGVVPVLYTQDKRSVLPKLEPGSERESVLRGDEYKPDAYQFIGRDRSSIGWSARFAGNLRGF